MTRALRINRTRCAALAVALAGVALFVAADAWAQAECSRGYCSGRRELPEEPNQDWRRDILNDTNRPLSPSGSCNITPSIAEAWARQSSQLRRLRLEFREAYESFDDPQKGVPLEMFGPPDSTERESLRKEAKEAIARTGNELQSLAYKYATRQFASCQLCYEFEEWGKIAEIALFSSGRPIRTSAYGDEDGALEAIGKALSGDIFKHHPAPPAGTPLRQPDKINVMSLTQAQIEDANVKVHVRAVNGLRENYRSLPFEAPPNRSLSAEALNDYRERQARCWKSNRPLGQPAPAATATGDAPSTTGSTPPTDPGGSTMVWGTGYDPAVCRQWMLVPVMNYHRNLLVDALNAVQDPKSQRMVDRWKANPKIGCTPAELEFPNIKWVKSLMP